MSLWLKIAVLCLFLLVHGTATWRRLYYKYERIDMITHLLGGLALGAFIKDLEIGFAIIFGWEILEMALVRENRAAFRENPWNKASDLFFSAVGYYFGIEFF